MSKRVLFGFRDGLFLAIFAAIITVSIGAIFMTIESQIWILLLTVIGPLLFILILSTTVK
jgi:hypothetical protein